MRHASSAAAALAAGCVVALALCAAASAAGARGFRAAELTHGSDGRPSLFPGIKGARARMRKGARPWPVHASAHLRHFGGGWDAHDPVHLKDKVAAVA